MRNLDFIIVFIICVIFGIDGRRHIGVKHRELNAPFLRIKECGRLESIKLKYLNICLITNKLLAEC